MFYSGGVITALFKHHMLSYLRAVMKYLQRMKASNIIYTATGLKEVVIAHKP